MSPDRHRSPVNRRRFVIALGSVGLGGAALLGSGALSRSEPQRSVTIESVDDENAYLRLVYGDIMLDECTQTDVELLTLTNQFKTRLDSITVDVTVDNGIELSDLDVPEALDVGKQGAVTATIECPDGGTTGTVEFVIEVGGEDTSLEADRPKRHEDMIELTCPDGCSGVSFVAFAQESDLDEEFEITTLELNQVSGDDAVEIEWSANQDVNEFLAYRGTTWYLYKYSGGTDGDTVDVPDGADEIQEGVSVTFSGEDENEAVRCPPSPGFGVRALKFEYNGGFGDGISTKDSCPPGHQ